MIVSKNSLSVKINPTAASEKVNQEIALGRIAGPFKNPPFHHQVISPLALRQKRNSTKFRLLHNLSAPYDGSSVNANIPDSAAKVKYSSISQAVQLILDHNCSYLAKSDIQDAFRLIPLHPSEYRLMGFKLHDKYYFDKCLPMGCRSSCAIFETFSDALVDILKTHYNVKLVIKVLDDFLFLAPTEPECAAALESFRHLAKRINLPLAEHKTVGPTSCLEFLGIELDCQTKEVRLPQDKLNNYLSLIQQTLKVQKAPLREIKSLAGKLSFASTVIPAGRTFIRRLYDVMIGLKNPNSLVSISNPVVQDLSTWEKFLTLANGKHMMRAIPNLKPAVFTLTSDSSKDGYGGVFQDMYFQGTFPDSWKSFDIQFLELYPIFLHIKIFHKILAGNKVLVRCDNLPIVHTLNKLSSKNQRVMKLIRAIVLFLMEFNIEIKAIHLPGKTNRLCDFLSRHQATSTIIQQYRLRPVPVSIPAHLRPQNLRLKDL